MYATEITSRWAKWSKRRLSFFKGDYLPLWSQLQEILWCTKHLGNNIWVSFGGYCNQRERKAGTKMQRTKRNCLETGRLHCKLFLFSHSKTWWLSLKKKKCLYLGPWQWFASGRASNLFNDSIDVNRITEILTNMHDSSFQGEGVDGVSQQRENTMWSPEEWT